MNENDFYKKLLKNLHRFFMSKTFDISLSEDLTSEVLLTVYEQFKIQQGNSNIKDREKYVYGIAKNVWLRYLRSKYSNLVDYVENVEDFEKYVLNSVEEYEKMSIIHRAVPFIEQLPEKQKQILLLRFRDGMSLKEICKATGSNMNYVKTTQKRGIASLKNNIQGDK